MDYAAAEITFIDRDSKTQKAYTYPVIKVILRERDKPEKGRVFVVDDKGKWIEQRMSKK